ncbi:MAG: glycoside hydrolase family 32 protein [Caldilineaceae bacterium]|nr:glycoside hydrolase family 32 protein [Caldilineaceae bacterium]
MENTPSAAERQATLRRFAKDHHRPSYHFLPPANWMNDPNGLVQWQGAYHLFYQYNPKGAWHERVHWGHAVSQDLVHWRDLPVALTPTDGGIDDGGCWSGCAVNLGDHVRLFYTGVRPQVVCTATSADADLSTWRKDPQSLIDGPPPTVNAGERADFRDPYVWREDDGWYMVMGSREEGEGGLALLYRSDDLCEWTYLHPLLVGDPSIRDPFWPGTMWECPNFFYVEGLPVLMVSVQDKGKGELRYPAFYAGDLADWRLVPSQLGKIDHGDTFYAPLTMKDDQGRMLMWGWLQEARSKETQRELGWSGVMSLPRELFLHPDGALGQRPAAEVETLRVEHKEHRSVTLKPGGDNPLGEIRGSSLEIEIGVAPGAEDVFNLSVLTSPDKREETMIRYAGGVVTLDRSRSSQSEDVVKESYSASVPMTDGRLNLRVFVDGSVVEIFANGRVCLSGRVYPLHASSIGVRLTGACQIEQIDVWSLASIW